MSKEKKIRVVALATVLSRLTGFFRDVLVYAVFGTSALNSAFVLAFTLPNLFRRLMGEGALTSALVPTLAAEERKNGKAAGFELLNKVMTRAAVALVGVIALGVTLFQLVRVFPLPERWGLAAQLGVWVFPYLFFVCLAALIGAALNLQGRFASTALAQIWVNLTMALMLGGVGIWLSDNDLERMLWVCGGVLLGGVLQLALPGWALVKEGWRPQIRWEAGKDKDNLTQIGAMLGPGMLGATVAQIDTAISQLLAFGLDEAATSVLFLANRLMQLPLGVFAVAVTTVSFPMIARKAAEGDRVGFAEAYRHSSLLIQAVMIPAGVGLALLAQPVLVACFQWGSFDAQSVAATAPILMIYALGLPFLAGTGLTVRALHSLQDTRAGVKWGIITLVSNLVLSLVLKESLHTAGLALSNVSSTALLAWGLRHELKKKVPEVAARRGALLNLILAVGTMAAVVGGVLFVFPQDKTGRFLTIVTGAAAGVAAYAGALYFVSRESFDGLKKLVWR